MSSACDTCPSKNGCTSQDSCPSANGIQKDPLAAGSSIKTVIGVASGKGGVGKSFVTSVLAVQLARKGYKVGIMDADITGPSIPQSFGLTENLRATDDQLIVPAETLTGIKTVSVNLVLENKEAPVIVPLTLFQSMPLDGIILVATSQDLVSMIVNKARNMASMMKVPVLGMVENMSYIKCPHCGDEIRLYGDGSTIEKSAAEIGAKVTDKLPLDPDVTKLVDSGKAEEVSVDLLAGTTDMVIELINK